MRLLLKSWMFLLKETPCDSKGGGVGIKDNDDCLCLLKKRPGETGWSLDEEEASGRRRRDEEANSSSTPWIGRITSSSSRGLRERVSRWWGPDEEEKEEAVVRENDRDDDVGNDDEGLGFRGSVLLLFSSSLPSSPPSSLPSSSSIDDDVLLLFMLVALIKLSLSLIIITTSILLSLGEEILVVLVEDPNDDDDNDDNDDNGDDGDDNGDEVDLDSLLKETDLEEVMSLVSPSLSSLFSSGDSSASSSSSSRRDDRFTRSSNVPSTFPLSCSCCCWRRWWRSLEDDKSDEEGSESIKHVWLPIRVINRRIKRQNKDDNIFKSTVILWGDQKWFLSSLWDFFVSLQTDRLRNPVLSLETFYFLSENDSLKLTEMSGLKKPIFINLCNHDPEDVSLLSWKTTTFEVRVSGEFKTGLCLQWVTSCLQWVTSRDTRIKAVTKTQIIRPTLDLISNFSFSTKYDIFIATEVTRTVQPIFPFFLKCPQWQFSWEWNSNQVSDKTGVKEMHRRITVLFC